jgi:hypothetical protein
MSDDLRRRHFNSLKNAFEFARADESAWRQGADQSYANQVRLILDCIARGIPCGTDPAELVPFFLTTSWAGRGDPCALWRAYAQAGYIDPTVKVQMHCKRGPLRAHARSGFVTLLPLEMAVALEHEAGFQGLLECGARAGDALSRQWKETKKPMDIFGFIKLAIRSDTKQARFRAISAKALGALPLELAVFNGNLKEFSSRLEAGDSISQVPSRQWESGARKPMDAMSFLKFACRDADLRVQFEALVANALMNELIARGGSGKTTAPSAPAKAVAAKKASKAKSSAPTTDTAPTPQMALELAGQPLSAAVHEHEVLVDVAIEQPTGARSNPRARRAGI